MAINYREAEELRLTTRKNLTAAQESDMLAGLDETAIRAEFRQAVLESVKYMALYRCGLDTSAVDQDVFRNLSSFSDGPITDILGAAVSSISEQALREIETTVKTVERRNQHGRNNQEQGNQRNTPSVGRGNEDILSDSERGQADRFDIYSRSRNIRVPSEPDRNAGREGHRNLGHEEKEVSPEKQGMAVSGDVRQSHPDRSSDSRERSGGEHDGRTDRSDDGTGRRDGAVESGRLDGVGTQSELDSEQSGRNRVQRPDLQINPSLIYQVITYSADSGTDEKPEYATLKEAQKAGEEYLADGYEGFAVFNKKENRVEYLQGSFPFDRTFSDDVKRNSYEAYSAYNAQQKKRRTRRTKRKTEEPTVSPVFSSSVGEQKITEPEEDDPYLIDNPVVTVDRYNYTIDFNRIGEIRFTREAEEYIGGLDSDGHERKDNYGVSEEYTSFSFSDGYITRYITDNGTDLVTKEQAIDEIEQLIHKALTTPDMSIRITDREGNISYLDRGHFTIADESENALESPDEQTEMGLEAPKAPESLRNSSYFLSDGKPYFLESGVSQPVKFAKSREKKSLEKLTALIAIRDTVRQLLEMQLDENVTDAQIQTVQATLTALYDDFAAKHGFIRDKENSDVFKNDSSLPLLKSLERFDEKGQYIGKADIFSKRTIKADHTVTQVATSVDALAVSIASEQTKGKVDLEYMAQLTGFDKNKIIADLQGIIFKVPDTDQCVTADEYLSGNILKKLEAAQQAFDKGDTSLAVNITALKKAMPERLEASSIDFRLGSTWIKPEYIRDILYQQIHSI